MGWVVSWSETDRIGQLLQDSQLLLEISIHGRQI
jgi:hypothetical protein